MTLQRPATTADVAAWTHSWLDYFIDTLDGLPRFEQIEAVIDAFSAAFSPLSADEVVRFVPVVRRVAEEMI